MTKELTLASFDNKMIKKKKSMLTQYICITRNVIFSGHMCSS